MAKVTKGKANRKLVCEACKQEIHVGDCCVSIPYRERAVSYREAMHAGTMYPTRHRRYHEKCAPEITRGAGAVAAA